MSSQAKNVSQQELKRVLAVVAARRFAERDRLALLTHWAGMRVCEVAALTRERIHATDGIVLTHAIRGKASGACRKYDRFCPIHKNASMNMSMDSTC